MPGTLGREDDEDFFDDDDGFDTLPDSTFSQLEQNAISSTQQRPQISEVPKPTTYRPLPYNAQRSREQPKAVPPNPARLHAPASESYNAYDILGAEDSDFQPDGASTPVEEKDAFIPQQQPDEVTQREQWRQQRFGQPTTHTYSQTTPRPHNEDVYAGTQPFRTVAMHDSGNKIGQMSQLPMDRAKYAEDDIVRAQIEDLIRERDNLMTKLVDTQTSLFTQKGEIAIIRENQKKESQTFDRQLAAFKKAAQDEASKHNNLLETLREEIKRLTTQYQFLKHELDQETSKNSTLQRTLKERPVVEVVDVKMISPSKRVAHSLRDGFDDGELMTLSPSKSGRRSKGGTPTAGNKRKRKVDLQSPIPPLVLRQPEPANEGIFEPPASPIRMDRVVPVMQESQTAEKNLIFLQRLYNHRVVGDRRRLIENFVNFALPSAPDRTFTTRLMEGLSGLSSAELPTRVQKIFIDLWSQALKEKYYKCIMPLLDVVMFIVNFDRHLMEGDDLTALLVVLQASAEINGTIRFKNSPVSQANFGKFKRTPKSELKPEIDELTCLEALYSVASTCLTKPKKLNLFWRSMSMDFVLLMLNSSQPIPQIKLILALLATSVSADTFAMISDNEEEQAKMESYVIDRVCWLLWESPRTDEGEPAPSQLAVGELRLEAMALLQSLAYSSTAYSLTPKPCHGSLVLARHRHAIARLVRCLYDEIAQLYTDMPSVSIPSPSSTTISEDHHTNSPPTNAPCTPHTQHTTLTNECTALLHFLLTTHADTIDLRAKLAAINGVAHRYRVALTRLAFSEGSVFHRGIHEETVSRAFELLEDVVTPEEAEGLVLAFPGWNGRERREERSSGLVDGGNAGESERRNRGKTGLRGGEGEGEDLHDEDRDDEEELIDAPPNEWE